MYESKLEAFVNSQGVELGAFMEACKTELLQGAGSADWAKRSPHAFILRVIQATSGYETFLQMMAEVAAQDEDGREARAYAGAITA
jgi:hypothetical protein